MDFRFLHAADIHLDSPLRGLSAYDGVAVERFRNATREAFRALIDHAIQAGVAFVVIAGDLYDGDWPDFGTGLFLVRELERLRGAGIRAVILYGNHDAQNRITRSLPWPDTAKPFRHDRPDRIPFDDLGVVLHGQSFARMDVTANLVEAYPPPEAGRLNIGVLHTALEGDARHARYAPCRLDQLCRHGYDYWALGHVHAHAILHRDPWVVFPGNLQGRHIREAGPKGCVAVTVRDGRIAAVEPVVLDVARWLAAEADVAGCDDLDQLQARCTAALDDAVLAGAEGRPAAIRLTIRGATALHGTLPDRLDALENALRAALMAHGDCWLESVRLRTSPPPVADAAGEGEAAGLLARLLGDAAAQPGLAEQLAGALRPLLDKLPADLIAEAIGDAAGEDGGDAPLLAALKDGRIAAIIGAVLPDLLALGGEG